MQDNISCALITAFERQYATNWDDPKLRNERLAMRYGWTAAMEAKQCLHQIQEPASVSNATSQAAPAAVAVPQDLRAAAQAALDWLEDDGLNLTHNIRADLRAALAATPAAAAQVVLPKPLHWVLETQALDREFDYTGVQKKAEHWKAIGLNPTALFTEQQLRAALLDGVSAPAAQAVEVDDQMALTFHHAITDTAIGQDDLNEIKIGLRAVLANVHTPQAQADALDPQLLAFAVSEIRRDEMTDSALLDAMEQNRIAVVPEYEGPWDAEIYNDEGKPNHRGSGSTPREAIRAAIAAQAAQQGGDKQ